MYFSEWGMTINNVELLDYTISLITLHNSSFIDSSKRLVVYSVFDYGGSFYMVIGNGGDSTLTSAFFAANNNGVVIHYPLKKPTWWNKESEREYLWNPDRSSPDCPDFPSHDIYD